MLWRSSYFIWSIFCLLMLDQMHISSGIVCKPGQMATHSRTSCVPCQPNQYNPVETNSKECLSCVPCALNSFQISPCTATSNTKCRCLDGFIPLDNTHKRCGCKSDSVMKTLENGIKVCEKCPPKTFPGESKCQPLPKYVQSTETIPGNATSDVNHENVAKKSVSPSSRLHVSQASTSELSMTPTTSTSIKTTTTSTSIKTTTTSTSIQTTTTSTSIMTPKPSTSIMTSITSTSTMTPTTSTSTMTATSSRNSVSTPTTSIPEPQDIRKHALWLVSLISFLLLILILKNSRNPKKKRDIVRQGSTCGMPVEESGEKFLPPV